MTNPSRIEKLRLIIDTSTYHGEKFLSDFLFQECETFDDCMEAGQRLFQHD